MAPPILPTAYDKGDLYNYYCSIDDPQIVRNKLYSLRNYITELEESRNPQAQAEAQQSIHQAEEAINLLRQRLRAMGQQEPSEKENNKPSGSTSFADGDGHYAGPSRLSTPASASTSGTCTASYANLAKRPRTFSFGNDYSNSHQNKSHKTATITTNTDDNDFTLADVKVILNLNDSDAQEIVNNQQAALARLKQETEDARIARALSEQWARGTPSPSVPTTAFHNSRTSAGPSNGRPLQNRMPGAYDFEGFDDGNDDDEDHAFGLRTNGDLAMGHPARPLPTHLHSASAAEQASQAALARQQRLRQSDLLCQPRLVFSRDPGSSASTTTGLANAAPGFSTGLSTFALPGLHSHRPGMLDSGLYRPIHGLPNPNTPNTAFNPASGATPGSTIANAIDLTGSTDLDEPFRIGRLENLLDGSRDNQGQNTQGKADFDKTAEEIRDLLANIRPDEDIPVKDHVGTPEAMKYPLYPHQQLALRWMIDSEEGNNKGGILADDMGLGKTISTLALMVSRRSSDKIKTNLIVGPVALIKQWEIEIKKKVNPRHQLRVLLYHGKAATFETMRKYDVVLTSYGKLSAEEKRSQTWEEDHPGQDPAASEDLAKSCPLMHPKSRFYRVILDEAQCIKSPFTYQSAGAARVRATHRWCLTGTPLMNGVFDLWALLRFLNIRPYSCQSSFTIAFGCLTPKSDRARANVSEAAKNKALRTLRILLKSIMLRRMKTSMLDGKALLTLPPKTEEVVHVVFDEEEREFYTALEAKTKVTFDQYLSAGTVGRNYSNVLVLLLRLRQACCHQHLNLDIDYVGTFETTRDQMISLAKSLGADVVRRLKDTCREGFACPICLDAVMDPTIVLPCGHSSCGECFATFVGACDENHLRAGDDRKPLKCPECRGQINTRHVINLAAFKAVHMPETELGSETPSNAGDDNLSVAEPAAGPAGQDKTDRNGNIQDVVVKGNESDVQMSGGRDVGSSDEVIPGPSTAAAPGRNNQQNNTKGKAREGKGKNKLTKVEPYTLKSLRMEARKNLTEYNRYMEYLRTRWMPSTKVDKCCEILESIQESGDKTLVFSQFTFLLDLLEIPIMHHLGIKCCRYDGSMSRNKRDAAIQEFQDPTSDTKVMLVSIKAGNSGLNLTAANHVIIMDPFFNYFVENQAIDRAHRIGQRKPVKVYRILVKDTIEDRIVDIQDNKRRMVDAALDEGEFKQLGRMSLQDIQYLFYGRE